MKITLGRKIDLWFEMHLLEYIYEKAFGERNGYKASDMDRLIEKLSEKIREHTTLFNQNRRTERKTPEERRVCLTYDPEITNKLKTTFKQYNMQIVYSAKNKLRDYFCSTTDEIDDLEKSGIYEVRCGDCEDKYYWSDKSLS